MNYADFGFRRMGCHSPRLHLGEPMKNVKEIIGLIKSDYKSGVAVSLFPELSLTGYSCEDIFLSDIIIEETTKAFKTLLRASQTYDHVIVVGAPFRASDQRQYNCAFIIKSGRVLGIVPKINIPNYKEFYERRWFGSGRGVSRVEVFCGQRVLLSPKQVFDFGEGLVLGVEICEDLWSPIPPSSELALAGATVILNLSASNELIGKAQYRRDLISQQSARLNCAYVYASSGPMESTKDVVFGGHCVIAENGTIIGESSRFSFSGSSVIIEVDVNKIELERNRNSTFRDFNFDNSVDRHALKYKPRKISKLIRKMTPDPFLPEDNADKKTRFEEIINIQATGLARRLLAMKSDKLVLGLSGGLDSTLAAFVSKRALEMLRLSGRHLYAISMPGLGTSDRTKSQADLLARALGATFKVIDIKKNVSVHMKSVGCRIGDDIVTENAQARERTQILFNFANSVGGLVVGTSDCSEIALGWSTYNGDHMSGYAVNASIPKTLVRELVLFCAEKLPEAQRRVVHDIVSTPYSPELLPTQGNKIKQKTESILGPYRIHDFILFHFIRNGFSRDKIRAIAMTAFDKIFGSRLIDRTIDIFFSRFYSNQFKRTCMPAGPKVGAVNLSPRDFRFPDEKGGT